MTTASVSKGCFVFKARNKQKVLQPAEYFCDEDGKVHSIDKQRWQTYEDCWQNINTDIQKLQSEVNSKIFVDLVNFIQRSHQEFQLQNEGDNDCSSKKKKKVIHEIPTAALITGVNTPDHNDMFCQLLTLLRDKITPYIALLGSKDCNNVKSTMMKLLSQLMGSTNHLDDDDDEDSPDINMRRIPCTMPVLCGWYKDKTQKSRSVIKSPRRSPGKSPHKSPGKSPRIESQMHYSRYPPIVLVLEDFENFKPHVLQDLLIICNQYLSELPIVLIFGIATAVTAVHRLLPHAVSSLLCIEKFQAQPATEYLAQFAMMDHFFNNTTSLLCCPPSEVSSKIKDLKSTTLDEFRNLDSFRRYVEEQNPEEQKSLLLDEKHFRKFLKRSIKQIWKYHDYFFPTMHCLHLLTFDLPGHPLGRRIRELYSLCLQGDIVQSESYQDAKSLLKLMAREELVSLLNKCNDSLSEYEDNDLEIICLELQTFISQFNSLVDCNEPDQVNQQEDAQKSNEVPNKPTGLYDLKKHLQESAKKKKIPTKFESLRNQVLEYLEKNLFSKYLHSACSLIFHEIFYSDCVSVLRRHLNASPRAAIQMALTNPHHYLQCDCCETEPGNIPNNAPDLCIVYRLHLECGRLINLYDWLQAYITIVDDNEDSAAEDENEESKKVDKPPDPVLQARFIRAVSELQFLSFIKPTKKKTDHVARLTWGGC
ncbi:origin recognition complex subunit 3-like [Saccoglossus kowalevskii]